MDHLEACEALEKEIERFASVLSDSPMQAPVGTCPGWNVSDLALHLGTVHRWAEHLVRLKAPMRIASSEMNLSTGPPTAEWMRAGGRSLLSSLRATDPATPMWAWGLDQHASFWSRRQLHETVVHRTDLEHAVGITPDLDGAIAADGVDEFLVNLAPAAYFSPKVKLLRGNGERLAFVASDVDRSWSVSLSRDGFALCEGREASSAGDVCLIGPAMSLLLVVYRRRSPSQAGVQVDGNGDLADFWMANTALE